MNFDVFVQYKSILKNNSFVNKLNFLKKIIKIFLKEKKETHITNLIMKTKMKENQLSKILFLDIKKISEFEEDIRIEIESLYNVIISYLK
jgi:hypothetical protein